MQNNIIHSYLLEHFQTFQMRKTIKNSIFFFLDCALRAKTLIPTKVGQKTITAYAKNGVKRVQRLLKNKFFTQALIDNAYCFLIKQLIPHGVAVKVAVDWTIIKKNFCFLSISWIQDSGRTIPLYFTGYVLEQIASWDSQGDI